mmetsp:Transcript_1035/g.4008  ORF Transcript_1035/g.4008 Transcript_1035/m.4008 type:complete len:227 (-) Transcript_1035:747-1427(-)
MDAAACMMARFARRRSAPALHAKAARASLEVRVRAESSTSHRLSHTARSRTARQPPNAWRWCAFSQWSRACAHREASRMDKATFHVRYAAPSEPLAITALTAAAVAPSSRPRADSTRHPTTARRPRRARLWSAARPKLATAPATTARHDTRALAATERSRWSSARCRISCRTLLRARYSAHAEIALPCRHSAQWCRASSTLAPLSLPTTAALRHADRASDSSTSVR